jgi:predicted DNA-binding transcriptional regulator YafY
MDRFTRIFKLHRILAGRRVPVSIDKLQAELECSRASVNRVIREMREYLDAPIEYDRELNGYRYAAQGHARFELPGFWLSPSELYALLVSHELLSRAEPGLLDDFIGPFRTHIEELLTRQHFGSGELQRRVRILRMAGRPVDRDRFRVVVTGLTERKRLRIRYHGRSRDEETKREISPQRLIHYRDNWYLDAWDHDKRALRSFSVDCIVEIRTLSESAREISDNALDRHFSTAYGIFSGKPRHTAVLRFTRERARWVADEQWHPQQRGTYLASDHYELSVPYSDPRELAMDILKYGPDAEVVKPASLRALVATRLAQAAAQYASEVHPEKGDDTSVT